MNCHRQAAIKQQSASLSLGFMRCVRVWVLTWGWLVAEGWRPQLLWDWHLCLLLQTFSALAGQAQFVFHLLGEDELPSCTQWPLTIRQQLLSTSLFLTKKLVIRWLPQRTLLSKAHDSIAILQQSYRGIFSASCVHFLLCFLLYFTRSLVSGSEGRGEKGTRVHPEERLG
jgi:hypothetical protein